jgi:Mn2+/Fe2+ NRAMP family transporter
MTESNKYSSTTIPKRSLIDVLGPGILYAAAAVGISHLIQATRAGAQYGLGLTLIIIIACIIKYPTIRFGGDYAAITGENLISNYKKQGSWVFIVYAIAQLFSMVFIIAAISLFTLGLFQAAFDFSITPLAGVGVLLTMVVIILFSGHYHFLEKTTKYIVAILTALIVAAVVLVSIQMQWSFSAFSIPNLDTPTVLFIIALMGFMPTPADASVLQSIWTCARAKSDGYSPSLKDSQLDFNVGYITSIVLALCFLIMGAGVMNAANVVVETSNVGFSKQLMNLFTQTIGPWSFPIIATAAIFVMISTLFTIVDGMTRITVSIIETGSEKKQRQSPRIPDMLYKKIIVILCLSALFIIATMLKSFATFIDITAVIVFIISPILAFFNHRAIFSEQIPIDLQPKKLMKVWSLFGIFSLSTLTFTYFYFRWII